LRHRVRDLLAGAGLRPTVYATEGPGHGGDLVRDHGKGFEAVVAVGGDGTLHDILQGLDLERHVLGLVPLGTGNDFACMNEWSADPESCIARIAAGRERRLDIGRVDGLRFHNSIGVGFEARVNRLSHRIRGLHGAAVYLAAFLGALPGLRSTPSRVEWDGGFREGPLLSASVANGRRVGGAFVVAPDARNDDGRLDLVLTGPLSPIRFPAAALAPLRGRAVSPDAVTAVSSWFRLLTPEGVPLYADGEFLKPSVREIRVETCPGVLRTF